MAVESERECGVGKQGEIEVRVSPMREKPVQAHGPVGGEPSGGRWRDVTTHHHHTSIEIENEMKNIVRLFLWQMNYLVFVLYSHQTNML